MKISGSGSSNRTKALESKSIKKNSQKVSETFGQALDSKMVDSVSEEVSVSSDIMATSALLASQEVSFESVNPDDRHHKQFIQWGSDILDLLENVRLDLLSGRLSEVRIRNILSLIDGKSKHKINDPQLEALINDIEVRATVELAKLEKFIE